MMTFFLLIILVYLGNKAIKNPSSFIIIITLSYVTLTLFQIGKNLYIVSILSVVVLCLIVRRWRESRTVFVNFPFKFAFVLCLSSYLLSLFDIPSFFLPPFPASSSPLTSSSLIPPSEFPRPSQEAVNDLLDIYRLFASKRRTWRRPV